MAGDQIMSLFEIISRTKSFMNYEELPFNRKLDFWLRFPFEYLSYQKQATAYKLFGKR